MTDVDAIVVGAGFSGLYMLHRLRELGLSAVVLERGRASAAPGTGTATRARAATSRASTTATPSRTSCSQEWEWTERYATQPEILRYLEHVADRFDLRRDIRLEHDGHRGRLGRGRARWAVETDAGDTLTAQHLVIWPPATSRRSSARTSPGWTTSRATGTTPARWPHEGVDFTGKRVAVIGTGSTGIQAIPRIAEQAEHLVVFQRTPNYSHAGARTARSTRRSGARRWPSYGERRRRARECDAGVPIARARARGAGRDAGGAPRGVRDGLAARRHQRALHRVHRPVHRARRRTRTAQEFVALEDPRDRPRPGRRRGAVPVAPRSARSAPASTSATSRPTTATTSSSSTSAARRSRRSRATRRRDRGRRAPSSTSSSSRSASTR